MFFHKMQNRGLRFCRNRLASGLFFLFFEETELIFSFFIDSFPAEGQFQRHIHPAHWGFPDKREAFAGPDD